MYEFFQLICEQKRKQYCEWQRKNDNADDDEPTITKNTAPSLPWSSQFAWFMRSRIFDHMETMVMSRTCEQKRSMVRGGGNANSKQCSATTEHDIGSHIIHHNYQHTALLDFFVGDIIMEYKTVSYDVDQCSNKVVRSFDTVWHHSLQHSLLWFFVLIAILQIGDGIAAWYWYMIPSGIYNL